jgi:hypothetical protein
MLYDLSLFLFTLLSKIDGLHVIGVVGFCSDDNVFDTNRLGGFGPRWKRSMAFGCPFNVLFLFLHVDLDTEYPS